MAPYKTTRSTIVDLGNINLGLLSKGKEGDNMEKINCMPRYIKVHKLKKPGVVTDRLHRDYEDLRSFDWILMKCGVRKILTLANVVQAVNAYWNGISSSNEGASVKNDDDSLVSYKKYERKMKYAAELQKLWQKNKD